MHELFLCICRYELAQAEVEQGKLVLIEDELKKKEEMWRKEREEAAEYRQLKEKEYASQALRRVKSEHRFPSC